MNEILNINKYLNKPYKYKQMCEIMGENFIPTTNGSKERNNQIKNWCKIYEIHKEGSYYFVVRELSEDEQYILSNQQEVTEIIKEVLIWYLANQNSYKVYLTYNKLFEIMHFVNTEYNKARFNTIEESLTKGFETFEECQVFKKYLDKFFYISKDIMADILDYVFKILESECVLNVKGKHFAFYDLERYIDENGKSKQIWKTTICTDEEVSKILSIQSDILENHGLKSTRQYYYCSNKEKKKINDEMSNMVRKEFGHTKYSKVLEFQLSKEVIKKKYDNMPLNFKIINEEITRKLKKSKRMKDMLFIDEFIDKYQKN